MTRTAPAGGLHPEILLPHRQEWELHHNSFSLCSKKLRVNPSIDCASLVGNPVHGTLERAGQCIPGLTLGIFAAMVRSIPYRETLRVPATSPRCSTRAATRFGQACRTCGRRSAQIPRSPGPWSPEARAHDTPMGDEQCET